MTTIAVPEAVPGSVAAEPGGLDPTAAPVRITVVGTDRRADVAVPATERVASLLPVLARHLGGDPGGDAAAPDTVWVLQRLGEVPVDPDATVDGAGIDDGDTLWLRPADDPLPELVYDDVSDGVAEHVGRTPGAWRPGTSRVGLLALAVLALVLAAVVLLRDGPLAASPLVLVAEGWVLAAAGTVGALVVDWSGRDRAATLICGLGGGAFALLTGLVVPRGAAGALAPGAAEIATGATCLACQAVVLAVMVRAQAVVWATTALVAGTVAVSGALVLAGLDAGAAAAAAALTTHLLATYGVRIALRLARLRVPVLPRTAEELQADVEPVAGRRLVEGAHAAQRHLTVLIVTAAVVAVLAAPVLARTGGWAGPLFAAVLGAAMLLQARVHASVAARAALLGSGTLCPASVLLLPAEAPGPAGQALALAGLLVAAGLAVLGSRRLPGTLLLPIWGHAGDVLETVMSVALVPLALELLGVFAFFRALFG